MLFRNPNEMVLVDTGEDSSDDSDEAFVQHGKSELSFALKISQQSVL